MQLNNCSRNEKWRSSDTLEAIRTEESWHEQQNLSILLMQPSCDISFSLGAVLRTWAPTMAAAHAHCWHHGPCHQLLWPMPTQTAGQAEVQPGISHSTAASLGVTCTKWNSEEGPSIAVLCHRFFFNEVGPRKLDVERKVSWDWCCCDAVKALVKWGL